MFIKILFDTDPPYITRRKSGQIALQYDVLKKPYVADMLWPVFMLMYIAQPFSSPFVLFVIRDMSILPPQMRCLQKQLLTESWSTRTILYLQDPGNSRSARHRSSIISVWVSDAQTSGGWVLTDTAFRRHCTSTTTHRQPTSLGIRELQRSLLGVPG